MKYLFLLSSCLLLAGTAHAQAGLRAGGNLAQLTQGRLASVDLYTGEARSTTSPAFGYQVGVFYEWRLSKRVALVPEVQFRRERVHVSATNHSFIDFFRDWDYHVYLSQVSIPVLARLTFGRVYLEAGPQVSALLQSRDAGRLEVHGWGAYSQHIDTVTTGRYRRFDVGPCLGVGVKLPANLGLSLRAYQGLITVNRGYRAVDPSDYGKTPEDNGQRRQYLEASLTYQLPARQQ